MHFSSLEQQPHAQPYGGSRRPPVTGFLRRRPRKAKAHAHERLGIRRPADEELAPLAGGGRPHDYCRHALDLREKPAAGSAPRALLGRRIGKKASSAVTGRLGAAWYEA